MATKLADMKLSKKETKEEMGAPTPEDTNAPKYPYGLKLRIEDASLTKIPGLGDLEVGDTVGLAAVGRVMSKSNQENDGDKKAHADMTIQIERLGLAPEVVGAGEFEPDDEALMVSKAMKMRRVG